MKRRPEVVHQDVQAIQRNLAAFDLVTLSAMSRIDKYEATDVGSSSEGPKPKHSISDPVGSRVVAKLSGRKVSDPVGQAVKEVDRALFDMRRASEVLIQQRDFILNPRERHKDNYIEHCVGCLREIACTPNDRARQGFCMQCYRAWRKEGQPNKTSFALRIRESQDS